MLKNTIFANGGAILNPRARWQIFPATLPHRCFEKVQKRDRPKTRGQKESYFMMTTLEEGAIGEILDSAGAHADTFHPTLQVKEKQRQHHCI